MSSFLVQKLDRSDRQTIFNCNENKIPIKYVSIIIIVLNVVAHQIVSFTSIPQIPNAGRITYNSLSC